MDHLRAMAAKGDPAWPTDLPKGLYPMFISPESGQFTSHDITLGARADSLYEYLLKQWIFSGRTDTRMRAMYDEAVAAIRQHLVRRGGGACSCRRARRPPLRPLSAAAATKRGCNPLAAAAVDGCKLSEEPPLRV
jgi:hypothetical protein